jgi:hypothetical protein
MEELARYVEMVDYEQITTNTTSVINYKEHK